MSFCEVRINSEVTDNENDIVLREAIRNRPIARNTGMTYSYDRENGLQASPKVTTVSTADLNPMGGVLSTARNNGFPVQSPDQITDNTIVNVGGMEMRAISAYQNGFLYRSPEGRYSEGKKG